MNEHLFSKININREHCYIPNGETADPEAECRRYEKLISEAGGIDLQILGIGENGHIGFNEPDNSLNCSTHLKMCIRDRCHPLKSQSFLTFFLHSLYILHHLTAAYFALSFY